MAGCAGVWDCVITGGACGAETGLGAAGFAFPATAAVAAVAAGVAACGALPLLRPLTVPLGFLLFGSCEWAAAEG